MDVKESRWGTQEEKKRPRIDLKREFLRGAEKVRVEIMVALPLWWIRPDDEGKTEAACSNHDAQHVVTHVQSFTWYWQPCCSYRL